MLVDGGGAIPIPGSPPPRLDVGERVVAPYLWSRRLKSIDVVLLTHAHSDHLGGLINVLRYFRVGELWLGPGPSNPEVEKLVAVAEERGIPVRMRASGDREEIDGVTVEVLSPPPDWQPTRVSNNDSVVLRLGYGARHIFLAGDAEARMERMMVSGEMPMASDVLKVGHHGSKTSTTSPFLSRVAPRFAMISVGAFSRFGHPNHEVIDALAGARVATYRTDFDGSVTASTDGNRIDFLLFRDTLREWPPFAVVNASHSLAFF
jgi:competence protein ComEC